MTGVSEKIEALPLGRHAFREACGCDVAVMG